MNGVRLSRGGSRGGVQSDELPLSKVRSILGKKKKAWRLKSFLKGAPLLRIILDPPLLSLRKSCVSMVSSRLHSYKLGWNFE